MIYVPAPFVLDSVVEAIEAGVKLVVVITEGVPTLDMVKFVGCLTAPGCAADWAKLPRSYHAG